MTAHLDWTDIPAPAGFPPADDDGPIRYAEAVHAGVVVLRHSPSKRSRERFLVDGRAYRLLGDALWRAESLGQP